jgi:hypothetical protein
MWHWFERVDWVVAATIVGILLLLVIGRKLNSMRQPYRSVVILLIVLAAGLAWNYYASPEDKRKVKEALCKPDPLFGIRRSDCP